MADSTAVALRGLERTFQVCTFQVAGRACGVHIEDVKEINTETRFTRIHHTAEAVLGYLNIRGKIYLIMDIQRLLGFEPARVSEKSRVILFKESVGQNFGFLVDEVKDIVSLGADDIQGQEGSSIVRTDEQTSGLISAECKLGDELLVLLRPRACIEILDDMRARS